jgi:hypothetical protein
MVYNGLGQCIFTSLDVSGDALLWDAKDKGAAVVVPGLYTIAIRSADRVFTARVVKQ